MHKFIFSPLALPVKKKMSRERERESNLSQDTEYHKLTSCTQPRGKGKSSMGQMWAPDNVRPTPWKLEVSSPQVGSHEEGAPSTCLVHPWRRNQRYQGDRVIIFGSRQVTGLRSSSRQCAWSSRGWGRGLVNLERTCPTQRLSDPLLLLLSRFSCVRLCATP